MSTEEEMHSCKYDQIMRWLHNSDFNTASCALCDKTRVTTPTTPTTTTSTNHCECYTNDFKDISSYKPQKTPSSNASLQRQCSNQSKTPENASVDTLNEMNLIRGCNIEKVKWKVARADLLFCVENSLFPVHRAILAEHSKVFKEYALDDQHLVVPLPHKVKHFTVVLNYIYAQHIPDEIEVTVNRNNVAQVLSIAEIYGIDGLVEFCTSYIEKTKRSAHLKKREWLKGMKEILGLRMFVKN